MIEFWDGSGSSWTIYNTTVVKVDRRIRWHYTTTILRLRISARLTRYRNCKFHNGCRGTLMASAGTPYRLVPAHFYPCNTKFVKRHVVVASEAQTICKQSAPCSREITTPTHHHSIFTGEMLFLVSNQQCQSTEGSAFVQQ